MPSEEASFRSLWYGPAVKLRSTALEADITVRLLINNLILLPKDALKASSKFRVQILIFRKLIITDPFSGIKSKLVNRTGTGSLVSTQTLHLLEF